MGSKALLAIVLLLLSLVWYFYLGPRQVSPPKQKHATVTQPQTPSAPAVPLSKLLTGPSLATEKTWSISNALYRMKIVAHGAR